MLRKLLIVFASGLLLAIAAFVIAWIAGGPEFRQTIREDGHISWGIDNEGEHGPRKTRQLAIASGSQLTVEVPANLDFERGPEARMEVEGPEGIVDKLIWKDGHLSLPPGTRVRGNLKIRIVAPEIGGLAFEAPADVDMRGLDQDSLRLASAGAIDLDARGKVRELHVRSDGAADIEAGKLDARDADVRMNGAGSITLAAVGDVKVVINGAGNVTLLKKPARLRTEINGVGSVDHDYEDADGRNDTTIGD
jgi:hypothetical protein